MLEQGSQMLAILDVVLVVFSIFFHAGMLNGCWKPEMSVHLTVNGAQHWHTPHFLSFCKPQVLFSYILVFFYFLLGVGPPTQGEYTPSLLISFLSSHLPAPKHPCFFHSLVSLRSLLKVQTTSSSC